MCVRSLFADAVRHSFNKMGCTILKFVKYMLETDRNRRNPGSIHGIRTRVKFGTMLGSNPSRGKGFFLSVETYRPTLGTGFLSHVSSGLRVNFTSPSV
jgi:hypothetical protein